MIRRFIAVTVAGGLAALGYMGAHRLGRWLDAPLADLPKQSQPTEPSATRDPSDPQTSSGKGWTRWSSTDDGSA